MTQASGSRIASVFIGPEGLRAGWRFLLFALAIVFGTWFVEEPLAHFLAQWFAINLHELSAPAMLIRKFVLCVSVFLLTAIAGTVERRRIDGYGLPVKQAFGRFFWKGMLAGLLVVVFAAVAMILMLVTGRLATRTQRVAFIAAPGIPSKDTRLQGILAEAENNSQVARNGRELILLQNLSLGFSVFQRFSFALCR